MNQYTANEFSRILAVIAETDPTTTEYHIALQSLECFAGIADSIEEIMEQIMEQITQETGEEPNIEGKIIKIEFNPEALKQQAQEEPAEETEPDPEPAADPEPTETYDIVTVRAAMRDAKKRGVDIVEIVKSFGASNLTDLDPSKYPELMQKLES